jgi:hypothetical protein
MATDTHNNAYKNDVYTQGEAAINTAWKSFVLTRCIDQRDAVSPATHNPLQEKKDIVSAVAQHVSESFFVQHVSVTYTNK